MFKWIRGFVSGVLMTIYASTILLLLCFLMAKKDSDENRRQEKKAYVDYASYRKERGE